MVLCLMKWHRVVRDEQRCWLLLPNGTYFLSPLTSTPIMEIKLGIPVHLNHQTYINQKLLKLKVFI